MTVTVCPQPDRLAAYLLGRLPPAEAAGVADHLDGCPRCRARVESLETAADPLLDQLRQLSASTPPAPDPELSRLMRRAKALAASPPPPAGARDRAGTRIGDYQLLRKLGAGTFGTVYFGHGVLLQRPVAIKVLNDAYRTHPEAKARFLREMQAVGRLPPHVNVVQALHAAETDGTLYLVMEYLEGTDLGSRVRQLGALGVAEVCAAVRQAALGLHHVHEQGLVHRDVKPSNLMLTAGGVVKVLDLGLARLVEGAVPSGPGTSLGQFLGTPDYVAPEQADDPRSAGGAADVYSLGCTLYYLLAGRVPFPGDRVLAKLEAHRRQEPAPLDGLRGDVPAALSALVGRMMAKNPVVRPTPAAAATALEPFTAGANLPASAEDRGTPPPDLGTTVSEVRPWSGRRWVGATGAGLLLIGLGIALAIALPRWWSRGEDQVGPTRELVGLRPPGRSLAFAPDGALAAEGGPVLACWPRGQEEHPVVWQHGGTATGLAPSNIAFAAGNRLFLALNDGPGAARLQCYGANGQRDGSPVACTAAVLCLATSADGERLLVAENKGRVRIHDARTQELQYEFHVSAPVYRAALASDGKRVLAGGSDGIVRLYDLGGQEQQTFRGKGSEDGASLLAVQLSADGTRVCAACGSEQTLRTWDAATGAPGVVLPAGRQSAMTCAAFTADGRTAFTGHDDGAVVVWDLDQRESRARYVRHQDRVAAVGVAADGRRAASVGQAPGRVWLYRLPERSSPQARP